MKHTLRFQRRFGFPFWFFLIIISGLFVYSSYVSIYTLLSERILEVTTPLTVLVGLAFGFFAYLAAKVQAAPQVYFAVDEKRSGAINNYTRFLYTLKVSPNLPSYLSIRITLNGDNSLISEDVFRKGTVKKYGGGVCYGGHFNIGKTNFNDKDSLEVVLACANRFVKSEGLTFRWRYNAAYAANNKNPWVYEPFETI